jgi:hypothetical protein
MIISNISGNKTNIWLKGLKTQRHNPTFAKASVGNGHKGKKIQEGLNYNMTKQNGNYYLRKP